MSAKLVDETDRSEVQVSSLCHAGFTAATDKSTSPASTPVFILCTALSTDAYRPHLNRNGKDIT